MPLDPDLYRDYLVAAALLALVPGPDWLLVFGMSAAGGPRRGLVAALGITVGNLVHAGLAALGITALVAASPGLFGALRAAGALYLAWLAVQAFRAAWTRWRGAEAGPALPGAPPMDGRGAFRRGLLTNLLNPKVVLFYVALVPQFVAPALGRVGLQTFLLGATLAMAGLVVFLALACLAGTAAGSALRRPGAGIWLEGASGVVFAGFALHLLLTR